MTSERALEIIAAYGADSRRWPAEEREAVQLAVLADPAVAAALAEARRLDALLGGWALDVAPLAPLDAATLIPATRIKPPVIAGPRRLWAGAAIAAAVTGLLLQTPLRSPVATDARVQVAATTISNVSPAPSAAGESQVLADAEDFATVFTPTADEDQLI